MDFKTVGAPISELPDRIKFVIIKQKGQKIMENTKKGQEKSRKSNANRYDEEFKAGAVRLVLEQKRPIKQAASDLGVCVDTLKNWVKAQNGSQSDEAKQVRALQSEIKALKKKVADQEDTIEILKKAAAIFSRP
jgi:transposase